MPYNSVVQRTDMQPLIPEDVSKEIIQGAVEQSIVFQMGRRLPNMPQTVRRMPVLDVLPTAYFVSGDTGLKQTTQQAWANKYIYAEELATIVPIPENVLADSAYDMWGEIRPRLVEAFGKVIDAAVLYGTNKPADWPNGIVPDATSASQSVSLATLAAATPSQDLYDALLSEGGVFNKVEEDGFMVSGAVAALSMKAKLRGLRSTTKEPIFTTRIQDSSAYELDGVPLFFPRNGALDPAQSLLVAGDFNQLVYAFRSDITYKLITEGVITDNTGAIIYNLPQQDMVALRAVIRLGWQVPNPINSVNPDKTTRYPFAVLKP